MAKDKKKKADKHKGHTNKPEAAAAQQPAASTKDSRSNSKTTANNGGSNDSLSKNIAIAALIILLLLAGIGFLIFGLVQSVGDNNDDDRQTETNETGGGSETAGEGESSESETDADEGVSTEEKTDTGNNNGNTAGAVDDQDNRGRDISSANIERFPATDVAYRRGNDYRFGDIIGKSYTVKRGDTLWQIAEARYGSGYAWVEINKANGGFRNLPNGKPVLIRTGQALVLPEI